MKKKKKNTMRKFRSANYNKYLKAREKLAKRYLLDEAISENEYIKLYNANRIKANNPMLRGTVYSGTNVADYFARQDITIDKPTAKNILSLVKKLSKKGRKETLDVAEQQQYDTLQSIYGSKLPTTQREIQNFNYFSLDTSKMSGITVKSQRQALFIKIWELFDSKDAAEEFFGY